MTPPLLRVHGNQIDVRDVGVLSFLISFRRSTYDHIVQGDEKEGEGEKEHVCENCLHDFTASRATSTRLEKTRLELLESRIPALFGVADPR